MEIERLNELMRASNPKESIEKQIYWEDVWNDYIEETSGFYNTLDTKEALARMISEKNYRYRKKACSSEEMGVWIRVGDICYIDFGINYLNEAGFQHFGLITKIKNNKALVIPMTSNEKTYQDSIGEHAKEHLMPIGKINGMNRNSVLFLNDARFINTARVIDVKAHINVESKLFKKIRKRLYETIM